MTAIVSYSRPFRGSRRARGAVAAIVAALATGLCAGNVDQALAHSYPIPSSQRLVVLERGRVARTRPSLFAPKIETVAARRPLTGARTVLPVLGYRTSPGGVRWIDVRLPGRPNGHAGWIPAAHNMSSSTTWFISVKLSARRLTVYHGGRVIRRFQAIVGKPSTPTPSGLFFVEEALALAPQESGSPFALATSARSDVLQQFDGGPGQIAIHGVGNLPEALGTAASHGCIRLSAPDISWLAERIGGGVPVRIYS